MKGTFLIKFDLGDCRLQQIFRDIFGYITKWKRAKVASIHSLIHHPFLSISFFLACWWSLEHFLILLKLLQETMFEYFIIRLIRIFLNVKWVNTQLWNNHFISLMKLSLMKWKFCQYFFKLDSMTFIFIYLCNLNTSELKLLKGEKTCYKFWLQNQQSNMI